MNNLFEEFQPISAKQWKQKIQFDLKGADYNEALVWQSLEGIDVRPFYHADDDIQAAPVQMPRSWCICQKIQVQDANAANQKAIDALKRGAQELLFVITDQQVQAEALLQGIQDTTIHIETQFLSTDYVEKLQQVLESKGATLVLHTDIIGNLARSGNWFFNNEKDHEILKEILELHDKSIAVDLSLYQNAGANMAQQLAYALAHANEYLNFGYRNAIAFNVSMGSNYFFEIAKLRALRWLWDTLAKEYHIAEDCHIVAIPSKRNKTLYDYNANLLRTTTEYMSAILGGADTICPLRYDAVYHKDNEFGSRIARNQLLVLKQESYFDKVSNPADGAYYIESLTKQLAEKALVIFKETEARGGLVSQLKKGTLQRKTKESAKKEQEAFNRAEKVLIGTNKYQNREDRMSNHLEADPFAIKRETRTTIEPIIPRRLSESLEEQRLKEE